METSYFIAGVAIVVCLALIGYKFYKTKPSGKRGENVNPNPDPRVKKR